jgi:hypothetical protein
MDLRKGPNMRYLRILALLGICLGAASFASAQRVFVGVGVGPAYVGPALACAYGYYGYYPYACAPYGYYGPDYFVGGVFLGAGPWFHGFYGHRGFYGRPGFYGRGFVGRGDGFRGRGGFDRGGFRGRPEGGFARGSVGGGFHGGGGGFHGGGGHGGHR